MAFTGIKGFFGAGNTCAEIESNDEFYQLSRSRDIDEEDIRKNKMILFEPRAYSESSQIVDYLKERNTVVVNLKRVTPDQAKRIIDFLTGSLYAMNGSLQKLGGGIFLCAPNNVNIEGKITDDTVKSAKGKSKEEKEEEFSW